MLYKSKNPHGGDIYGGEVRLDFSANTNPRGTPRAVIEAAVSSLEYADRYPDPYARELTAAISSYHGVPQDYVLAGAGAAELIYSYCLAGRFKKALLLAPTFSEYELGLRASGDVEIAYHVLPEGDSFDLNYSITESIKKFEPEVLFICNPNNPTGRLADPGLLKDIIEETKGQGIRVFLDECFVELAGGETMIPLLGDHDNLTILRAFTKNYGMAGLRLGYVLSSDEEYLGRMAAAVQPWNLSTPAQAAGVQALKETEFLKESISLIKEEREFLTRALKYLGFKVVDSDVNFLLFHGPEDLWERMKEEGILIRNCDNYEGLGPGWFRVAVKLHHENEELIRTLEEVLGKE